MLILMAVKNQDWRSESWQNTFLKTFSSFNTCYCLFTTVYNSYLRLSSAHPHACVVWRFSLHGSIISQRHTGTALTLLFNVTCTVKKSIIVQIFYVKQQNCTV